MTLKADRMVVAVDAPLVSIIVNNYNYARYLGAAIQSALSQTYAAIEVLVVDDGSSDDSRVVISTFGNKIVPVLKDNGGQASAFNAGFSAANGRYILFLDSDDILLPQAISRAVGLMSGAVVKVHWPMLEVDANARETGALYPDRVLADGDLRRTTLTEGPIAGRSSPTSGNLWSRDFLEHVLPMPEDEFRINADGYLIILAYAYGVIRALPQPLGLYRIHGANHFASISPQDRKARHVSKFMHQCDALALHLRSMGFDPKPTEWKKKKGIIDPLLEVRAKGELEESIPRNSQLILVDEEGWGDWSTGPAMQGRRIFPFLERGGEFWGRPESDRDAIEGLERLRKVGAEFLAFTWFTAWWLDAYPDFAKHVRTTSTCIVSSEYLTVFDLRTRQPE